MSRAIYVATLDKALAPLGFVRAKIGDLTDDPCWARKRGDVQEVVSLQTSSFGRGKTANLYTRNLTTERLLSEVLPARRTPFHAWLDARIGSLIDGYDHWWTNDAKGAAELAEAVVAHSSLFFDRWLSLEQQAAACEAAKLKWGSTRSRVRLALTLYQMGETGEACEILSMEPPKWALKRGVDEYYQLRQWLGCGTSPLG